MTREQVLLTQLAEECAEVAQRAAKAVRFGINEIQIGQDKDNRERLEDEFADLIGVYETLFGELNTTLWTKVAAKKEKIEKYLEVSRIRGILKE